ncbi:NAD(P)-dependent oxidoreductase [Amycolatopsis taiwanensis]|uniref:3-beta hydroxysteroid dehydrogenase n=1 Tax=Amycolatopsis taiwanensis TaxID=342230 RepID=A0A9W6VJH3_9PSEU|nr:NAD(P)H-binding protein [Amycolatopsis taiwanensis]GLY69534.1 3-beta hydroxysteroid dehydrogenase [Amycolatopsis taiwanensis]
MKIIVVGANGMVGSRVTDESVRRGHDVTAVVRGGSPRGVPVVYGNAADREQMSTAFSGSDAVVVATRPRPGQEHTVSATTAALLDAAAATGTRILVVGGAGPLRSPDRPGLVIEDPSYVPPQWRSSAEASIAQLRACHGHPADWTYLSPPAILEPGVRTGHYRRGTTTLVVRPDGTSRISAEDLAVAIVDELENPGTDRHFTVGY